jgi:hypothetical protein
MYSRLINASNADQRAWVHGCKWSEAGTSSRHKGHCFSSKIIVFCGSDIVPMRLNCGGESLLPRPGVWYALRSSSEKTYAVGLATLQSDVCYPASDRLSSRINLDWPPRTQSAVKF